MARRFIQFTLVTGFAALLPLLAQATVYTTNFAREDRDDNAELQNAISYCSQSGETCVIPAHKQYRITTNLFIWGKGSLIGEGDDAGIVFKPTAGPVALFNVGLRPKQPNNPAKRYDAMPEFSGKISNLIFTIDPSVQREQFAQFTPQEGVFYPNRLIYFWRTNGAEISHNHFYINHGSYSATGSGNFADIIDARFLIRRNIRIVDNVVESLDYQWSLAHKSAAGNEGISLTLFDGAYIAHNTVIGVSDDAIAYHYSGNGIIEQNYMDVTDGRIFTSSSRCVAILYNYMLRRPLYKSAGIAGDGMIVMGQEAGGRPATQYIIAGNRMVVPKGANNTSGGIFAFSGRSMRILNNYFYNTSDESAPSGVKIGPQLQMRGYDVEGLENAFNAGPLTAPNQGCFKDTPLTLPSPFSFLPIAGDNYYALMKESAFLPARNIEISHNNFAPGGNYKASGIAFGTVGTWAALLGNTSSQDACNKQPIVGEQPCHTIAITGNTLGALPWQQCIVAGFSNKPSGDELMRPNSSCAPHQGPLERVKATQVFAEKIYYGDDNITGNTAKSLAPAPIPGRIEAEEFITQEKTAGVLGDASCAVGQTTNDITGQCDILLKPGEVKNYAIQALESASYQLVLRVKSSSAAQIRVQVDGKIAGTLEVTPGPNYQNIQITGVNIKTGLHQLQVSSLQGQTRFNHMMLQINRL